MKRFFYACIFQILVATFLPLCIATESQQTQNSNIITCTTITELEKYLEPNTLCAVDLDNTIVECVNEQEGEQWFAGGIKYLTSVVGVPPQQAREKMISFYHKVHEKSSVKPVEQQTLAVINTISQQKNIYVLALTSRFIILPTFREFEEIKLNFDAFHIPNTPHVFNLSVHPAYYLHGILFCGNNKKGEALTTFLKTTKLTPKKIILIDDKKEHLISVEEALRPLNIPFLGLHYTYLADKVNNYHFDPQSIIKMAFEQ